MIVDYETLVNVTNKTKSYFISKGYDVENKKQIRIKIIDLATFSHHNIKVKCDICGCEKMLGYYKYMKNTKLNTTYYACSQKCAVNKLLNTFDEKYGCVSSQHPDIKLKQEKTNIKLYGGKSPQCSKRIKNKSYNTMLKMYGVKYSYQNNKIKEKFLSHIDETVKKSIKTKIRKGLMVDYDNCNNYNEYRKLVACETRKHKFKLFENWNGFDYYDHSFIYYNKNLHHSNGEYPSIDHKYSILNGFIDGVDPYKIGHINNLCITTRCNNSKKNSKNLF